MNSKNLCTYVVAIATVWHSSIVEFDQIAISFDPWLTTLACVCVQQDVEYVLHNTTVFHLRNLYFDPKYPSTSIFKHTIIIYSKFFMLGGSLKIKYAVNSVY